MKRGTKVRVKFDGVVINKGNAGDAGVRVAVHHPKVKKGWWAVVPEEVVDIDDRMIDEAEV